MPKHERVCLRSDAGTKLKRRKPLIFKFKKGDVIKLPKRDDREALKTPLYGKIIQVFTNHPTNPFALVEVYSTWDGELNREPMYRSCYHLMDLYNCNK